MYIMKVNIETDESKKSFYISDQLYNHQKDIV